MKVLLVDDDSFTLKLHTRLLANCGFLNVVAHEQAIDAVALLELDNQAFDLILCDLQMPGMDGVEFIRRLVHIRYEGALVLVSGEDSRILQTAEKLSKAHRLNVLGTLKKPVSSKQLQQVLQNNPMPVAKTPDVRKIYAREELSQAISGDELINYYQPKVDLESGNVIGVEALVRWRHRADGLVYPDQFIGLAEKSGLIDDLTRVVLGNALHQARIWQDAGLQLCVAVNVSMDNLISFDFPDFVAQAVHQAGVPPTSLILEVTESQLMNDPLMALDILTRLRLKRISLSIDDFGTGHSSLAQLRDIPFDELKVDQSFVHGVGRDPSLRTLFDASLGMGRQLGMKTVAEGVEDREDWDFLRSADCDTAQGYFIAKPMTAAALPCWIEEWEERCENL